MIKMIDAAFERDKNYFLSYKNIYRACFRMLDDLVPPSFKVSNVPALLGWKMEHHHVNVNRDNHEPDGKPLLSASVRNVGQARHIVFASTLAALNKCGALIAPPPPYC